MVVGLEPTRGMLPVHSPFHGMPQSVVQHFSPLCG